MDVVAVHLFLIRNPNNDGNSRVSRSFLHSRGHSTVNKNEKNVEWENDSVELLLMHSK